MILVEEMFTTAGNTLLTTGANVLGIVTGSLTGVAAATAAAGARPASIAELPTKAPPAMDPMLSMTSATTHMGYLAIRFMIFPLDKMILNTQKVQTDEI
jgi:hypothetical protein